MQRRPNCFTSIYHAVLPSICAMPSGRASRSSRTTNSPGGSPSVFADDERQVAPKTSPSTCRAYLASFLNFRKTSGGSRCYGSKPQIRSFGFVFSQVGAASKFRGNNGKKIKERESLFRLSLLFSHITSHHNTSALIQSTCRSTPLTQPISPTSINNAAT